MLKYLGWNNLDTVRTVHNVFEINSLIFFCLMVMFDVLVHRGSKRAAAPALICMAIAIGGEIPSYLYGHRSDVLSERVIVSLSSLANDAAAQASAAVENAESATRDLASLQEAIQAEAINVAALRGQVGGVTKQQAELTSSVSRTSSELEEDKPRRFTSAGNSVGDLAAFHHLGPPSQMIIEFDVAAKGAMDLANSIATVIRPYVNPVLIPMFDHSEIRPGVTVFCSDRSIVNKMIADAFAQDLDASGEVAKVECTNSTRSSSVTISIGTRCSATHPCSAGQGQTPVQSPPKRPSGARR